MRVPRAASARDWRQKADVTIAAGILAADIALLRARADFKFFPFLFLFLGRLPKNLDEDVNARVSNCMKTSFGGHDRPIK